jgi:FMN-dependent NADH-azoreductase
MMTSRHQIFIVRKLTDALKKVLEQSRDRITEFAAHESIVFDKAPMVSFELNGHPEIVEEMKRM